MLLRKKLMEFLFKLFNWGFMGNCWVWFHMLGGASYANLVQRAFTKVQTLLSLLAITIAWEIVEFVSGGGSTGMIAIYGTLERWAFDSIGDIIGAMCIALMVIF